MRAPKFSPLSAGSCSPPATVVSRISSRLRNSKSQPSVTVCSSPRIWLYLPAWVRLRSRLSISASTGATAFSVWFSMWFFASCTPALSSHFCVSLKRLFHCRLARSICQTPWLSLSSSRRGVLYWPSGTRRTELFHQPFCAKPCSDTLSSSLIFQVARGAELKA